MARVGWPDRLGWHEERGSIVLLTALLLPAVVAFAALALGGSTLWAGRRDVQRAADLASLTAAAASPTASTNGLPFDPDGLTTRLPLPLPATALDDWRTRPCAAASSQFDDGRSTMATAFAPDAAGRGCTATWTWENPAAAALAGCAADALDIGGCGDRLTAELADALPVWSAATPALDEIEERSAALADRAAAAADRFLSRPVVDQLVNGCTRTVPVLGIEVCVQRVVDLIGLETFELPTLGLDLAGVAPAVATPRVTVELDGFDVRPPLSPATFELGAGATARRTLKTVVVLPSLGLPTPDGYTLDPNEVTSSTPDVIADTLDALDEMEPLIADAASTALDWAACRGPVSQWCPTFDDVTDPDELLAPLVADLRDATEQPPTAQGPSVETLLAEHADTGEPLWAVGALRRTKLREILGEDVWSVLTDPSVNPLLAPLLSDVMFVPAFDVIPATVGRTIVGGRPVYTLERLPLADTLATAGLYRARLVR